MLRVAVFVLGVAGWLAGLVLIHRLRATTAPRPVAFAPEATFADRLLTLFGRGAGSLAGALVAGWLVIGLGGRLMMRVMAATSSDGVQGATTDMEAKIGVVTLGGSLFFVIFVGMGAGVLGWALRLVTRRWLPDRSLLAGLVGAGIGAGLLARPSSLLEPENRDFILLTPDWLAVTLILGMILTFALLLAVLSDRITEAWPRPAWGWRVVWAAPVALVLIAPPLALVLLLGAMVRARSSSQFWPRAQQGTAGPSSGAKPAAGPGSVAVGSVGAGAVVAEPSASPTAGRGSLGQWRHDAAGRAAVGIASILGGAWTIAAAVEILRG